MAKSSRPDRVATEIHGLLSELIRRDVRDPRVRDLTITATRMSHDLGVCWVKVVPLGGQGDEAELIAGLTKAAGFLRGEVGRRLGLRRAPELRFELDKGIEQSMRVTSIIDGLSRPPSSEE